MDSEWIVRWERQAPASGGWLPCFRIFNGAGAMDRACGFADDLVEGKGLIKINGVLEEVRDIEISVRAEAVVARMVQREALPLDPYMQRRRRAAIQVHEEWALKNPGREPTAKETREMTWLVDMMVGPGRPMAEPNPLVDGGAA